MSKLIITEDGRDKVYEIVDDEFTIGRSPGAECQVRDEEAAAVHLKVKKGKAGYQIIDMETKSGTKVNGKLVNEHWLSNGDTIEIGQVKITYMGKGPVRAAAKAGAAGGKKKLLQTDAKPGERVYRNQKGWDDKMGNGARVGLMLGGIALVVLILYLALKNTDRPTDHFTINLRKCEEAMDLGQAGLPDARKALLEAKKYAESSEQKAKLRKLELKLDEHQGNLDLKVESKGSDQLWTRIENTWLTKPDHILKIKEHCDEFLLKYDSLDLPEEAKVRDIMAKIAGVEMSPERTEATKIYQQFDEFYEAKEYRKAWETVTQTVDPKIKALFSEEMDKLAKKAQRQSRAALTVRKNDARHALREGKPSEARQMVEDIFDKIVPIAIDQYILSPDRGYENPDTARFELEIQELLKKVRDERKGR